jgi:hypothetical protein
MDGTGLTYSVRANAFEHDATWRLGPDALEMTGGNAAAADATITFPYKDVSELRLSFSPTRLDSVRYRCDIRLRTGRRTAILSTHYAGLGDFKDRASTYAPFVRGLIARVASANSRCRFRSGKTPLVYWGEHLFLLTMITLLVMVLFMIGGSDLSESSWAKLTFIIGSIPLAIAYTYKNWPRSFRPNAIPQAVLPEATT